MPVISRLLPMAVALATAALASIAAPSAARLPAPLVAAPAGGPAFEVGHIPKCLEAVPAAVGTGRSALRLDALVLSDGVAPAAAADAMRAAAGAYRPLGINLVARVRPVSFTGTSASGLVKQAKSLLGGRRPAGVDVVHVVTDKDIAEEGTNAVVGFADCIGGVAFADRAFSVSEARTRGARPAARPLVAAKIAAHEIGHLMGAHHHYANCVESALSAPAGDVAPCTLMFNAVDLASLRFSTLNGLVVRGHAEAYAAP